MVSAPVGLIQPHVLLLRIPNTVSPRPIARERGADDVELRAVLGPGAGFIRRRDEEDRDHDHDLAHEHVPPAERRRHIAADQRPGGDRGAGDAADHPVRERAVLALVVGDDQRGDRRDHEHRAEPLDQRPAEEQRR